MVSILFFCVIGVLHEENSSFSDRESTLERVPDISDFDTDFKYANSWLSSINETSVRNNIHLPANTADLPNNDDDSQNQNREFRINRSENIREQKDDLNVNEDDVPENNNTLQKNADCPGNVIEIPISNGNILKPFQEQKRKSTRSSSKLLPKFCVECNVSFKIVREYEKHAREHHSDKKLFYCTTDDCDRSFTSRATFYMHRKIAHNLGRRTNSEDLYCRFCRENFDNSHAFGAHFKKLHPGEKKYKCKYCSRTFHLPSRKVQHEKDAHLQGSFKCVVCCKSFNREWNCQNHEKKCREKSNLILKKEKEYECEPCRKIFKRRQYLQHMRHHEMYPPCPICGTGFAKRKGMDRLLHHIRWNHPEEFPKVNMEEVMEYKGKKIRLKRGEQYDVGELQIDVVNEAHETINNVGNLENARESLKHDADQPITNQLMTNEKFFLGQIDDCLMESINNFLENVIDPFENNDNQSSNNRNIWSDFPENTGNSVCVREFPNINIEEVIENEGKICSWRDGQREGDEFEIDVDNEEHETLKNVGSLEDTRELEDVQELQEHDADQPISNRQITNDEIDDYMMESIHNFMENVIDPLEKNDNQSSTDQNVSLWWRKWCDHWATYSCEESSWVSSKRQPFCAECNEPFKNIWDYVKHVGQSHANKKLFRCNVPGCGKRFTALSTLYDHRTENHLTGKTSEIIGKHVFICRLCGGEFRHFRQLDRHFIKRHPGEKKYKCKYCTETFDKMEPKQQHELKEHEDRYFECDVCHRTFTKAWYLSKHAPKCWGRQSREIAEHEWIQECHLCRKKFIFPRDQERYTNHMRRYKKYPHCPVCGIILKEKNSDSSNIPILVNHIRWRHPDEFPKINIKAVLENKEMTSVWKIEENVTKKTKSLPT